MFWAVSTLAPMASPVKIVIYKFTTELVLPTAAKALLLANRPTTITSVELNSCSSMVVAARGRANNRICFHRFPFRIPSLISFTLS